MQRFSLCFAICNLLHLCKTCINVHSNESWLHCVENNFYFVKNGVVAKILSGGKLNDHWEQRTTHLTSQKKYGSLKQCQCLNFGL